MARPTMIRTVDPVFMIQVVHYIVLGGDNLGQNGGQHRYRLGSAGLTGHRRQQTSACQWREEKHLQP